MNHQFEILKKNRAFILKVIDGLSIEQLNKIPKPFNNNILWNVSHLLATQQLLCYKLSGLPMLVTDEFVELYRKGTFPEKEMLQSQWNDIKEQFAALPLQFENDYTNGIFKTYTDYTTSVAIDLTGIDAAIAFNNFHEGIHLGYILALKKLI